MLNYKHVCVNTKHIKMDISTDKNITTDIEKSQNINDNVPKQRG